MRRVVIFRGFPLLVFWIGTACSIDQYYIEGLCGGTLNNIQSMLLDTSQALTYSNNQDCTTTVYVPGGQRIFLQIRRFSTEEAASQCFDHFSIYDGTSRSATPLLLRECGQVTGEPTYNTSSNAVTFHFKSDGTAKDRGFSVFLLAFTSGSCSDAQLFCDTWNICIDEASTWCDDFRHCPGGIDEDSCLGSLDESPLEVYSIGLAVGLSVLGVIICIIVMVIVYHAYKKYKWNQFLTQLYSKDSIIETKIRKLAQVKQQAAQPSYPITHHYQSDEYINKKRMAKEAQIREGQIQLPSQSEMSLQSAADQPVLPRKEESTDNNELIQPLSQSTPRSEPKFSDKNEVERPSSGAHSNGSYTNQGFSSDEKDTEL